MENIKTICGAIVGRTKDGNGYNLNDLDPAFETEDCTEESHEEQFQKALFYAGYHIDTDGGLILLRDNFNGREIYIHFNGFSGEATILPDKNKLRSFLKSLGMWLCGNYEEATTEEKADFIAGLVDSGVFDYADTCKRNENGNYEHYFAETGETYTYTAEEFVKEMESHLDYGFLQSEWEDQQSAL